MHPAFSVIFLTTSIGMGQGLMMALMTVQTYDLLSLVVVEDGARFYGLGALVVLVLLILGLVASLFHLGHPERAWRAAARWRTSWLSREVIALPILMFLVFVYGVIHYFRLDSVLFVLGTNFVVTASFFVGVLAVLASVALFVCTGMIYACIKFIQEWASPLTVINHVMFGLTSGFMAAAAFSVYFEPQLAVLFTGWAMVFILVALVTRLSTLVRNARLKPRSTPESAIGVRHSKITQIAQGAMGGSYNTREYFHGKSPLVVQAAKWTFLLLVFAVSLALLTWSFQTNNLMLLLPAVVLHYLGMLAERWFFFAQANHPQNIYYQST